MANFPKEKKGNIAIKVEDVSKTFEIPHEQRDTIKEYFVNPFRRVTHETFNALEDVSLEVRKGEFLGIIGRNGSGKSTLLKLMAGIYEPDGGRVIVGGRITPFLELGVGFNMELTARENIFLNGVILGLTRKQIAQKYDEIVKFAEIEKFVDTQLKNFSSGMQVRLGFAIAIQAPSDIILIDEILAVGDANFQAKCIDVFQNFKKEGKTIIFVSHDLGSIRRFCDRCVYMEGGHVVKIGLTSEVLDLYTYEREAYSVEEGEVRKAKRLGDKKVEITDVKFLNDEGKETKNFTAGDEVTIEIEYVRNDEAVETCVFGIAMYRDDDTHVFGTNTDIAGKNPQLEDKGRIRIRIKNLNVVSGNFLFTVAAHTKTGKNYDWIDKGFQINVQPRGDVDGLVDMRYEWRV